MNSIELNSSFLAQTAANAEDFLFAVLQVYSEVVSQ